MAEGNIYFIKAGEICQRRLQTASPGEAVDEIARRMSASNISSVIITEGQKPLGIITDRDLRNKVISVGANAKELKAVDVMSSPLITMGEEDELFDAVYKMSRHKLHRIIVLDKAGNLLGIIAETDIMRLQANTPQFLIKEIDQADRPEELKKVFREITGLVISLRKTGVKTPDIVRLIAHINDALLIKIISLLTEEEFFNLPRPFSFVALGSEGRIEQTLKTDQDNAIIFDDSFGEAEREKIRNFSLRLVDSLIEIGVPPCPGGTMAKNPQWRRSLSEWKEEVDRWMRLPSPDNILNYSMFSDVRTVWGDPTFEARIKEHIIKRGSENAIFLAHMAKNVVRFEPPLGIFGKIKTIKEGPQKGMIDIKSGGIFPISDGIKSLALEGGFLTGGTREKIELLKNSGSLSRNDATDLLTTFNFFSMLRLRTQIEAIEAGRAPTNYINPDELGNIEKMSLKIGFEAVKSFQNLLKLRFRLNFISD